MDFHSPQSVRSFMQTKHWNLSLSNTAGLASSEHHRNVNIHNTIFRAHRTDELFNVR